MFEPNPLGAMARACAIAWVFLTLTGFVQQAHAETISVFGRALSISGASRDDVGRISHRAHELWIEEITHTSMPMRAVYAMVARRALELGVPPRMAVAIARFESGGHCRMHGRAGERGAMQVLPQTARQVGVTGDLDDCTTGIEAGLRYLRLALAQHGEAGWCAVASAYNVGTWRGSRCTRYGHTIADAAGLL